MDGRSAAATLGVGPQATKDEIRRAFRARAKLAHPDAAGPAGSDEAFIALRAAFELLLPIAPEEPARPCGPGPARATDRWMTATSADRHRPTVLLTDLRRTVARRPAPAPARPEPARDARGLSFDDHLAAAMAGRP
jgi:hypothetical protein